MSTGTPGAEFERLSVALRQAADKNLNRNVSKAMREVARPVASEVLREAAAEMPQGGGFAQRLQSTTKISILSTFGSHPRTMVKLRGMDLRSLDDGILRHPLFGNRKFWSRQDVPAHAFSRAFDKKAEHLRVAAVMAADATLRTIKREA